MRILLVHRYFWPDVPTYAHLLRHLGEHLADDGHEVTVFCGPPTYNDAYRGPARPRRECVGSIAVERVALPADRKDRPAVRAISMVVFAAKLIVHAVRRPRYDLITVTTIPPIVMGLAARAIQRLTGTRFLYHCMDLYPELAEVAGLARFRPFVAIARHLDRQTCSRATRVVVLSEDMQRTLAARGSDTSNVLVINNFDVDNQERGSSPLPKRAGVYRIVFAGNMGRFQGLEQLVDAVATVAVEHPELELVLVGSGARVQALRASAAAHPRARIIFVPHQPIAAVTRLLEETDLGVVSLAPGIYQVAFPSKTMTYLKAGCRLLVVVEEASELARLVTNENLGVVCPPGDVESLVAALRREVEAGPSAQACRGRLQAAGEQFFGRAATLGKWSKLVRAIETDCDVA